jgi:hypothetical protein
MFLNLSLWMLFLNLRVDFVKHPDLFQEKQKISFNVHFVSFLNGLDLEQRTIRQVYTKTGFTWVRFPYYLRDR